MYFYSTYKSPIGMLTIVSNDTSLVGLWIKDQKYFGGNLKDKNFDISYIEKDDLPIIIATKKWLDSYFLGENPNISDIPISPEGSEFRKLVWKILCEIPFGQTTTYGEIAKKIAKLQGKKTMSAQAVGGAVGHNPIGIIVPCHRVIGKDGNLTGFAAGIDKKEWLLKHEKGLICEL